jgi:hypothetical protein
LRLHPTCICAGKTSSAELRSGPRKQTPRATPHGDDAIFQGDPTSNKGQDKFEVPVPSGDLPQIDVAGASKAGVY